MPKNNILNNKSLIRKELIKDRNNITLNQINSLSNVICDIIFNHLNLQNDFTLAGYHPINSEVNILPLLKRLTEEVTKIEISTCLPVIVDKNQPLIFKKWSYGQILANSKFFKIKEPKGKVITPNIIIVPLVAFDNKKNRLGYGGGFYDRTLDNYKKNNHNAQTIGVAYSMQKYNKLPTLKTDQPLDIIITEDGVIL